MVENNGNTLEKPSLEETIAKALWQVHEMEQQIQEFSEDSQSLLFERVNAFVDNLTEMQSSASNSQVEVPVELLRVVDEGKHPETFSVSHFEHCIHRNQVTKGKVELLAHFHNHLLKSAKEAFPEEVKEYLRTRDGSAMGVKTEVNVGIENGQV
mmetsp:Transcript_6083/g.8244  ORF Transcript_6083/g.8244 Transcript_6083/m.8244 type:complete len:154 (+) Transcript_6083:13-474(+)